MNTAQGHCRYKGTVHVHDALLRLRIGGCAESGPIVPLRHSLAEQPGYTCTVMVTLLVIDTEPELTPQEPEQRRKMTRKADELRQEEEALYAKWPTPGGTKIVRDGAMDPERYLTRVGPKILFVLKEANDPDGGGWHLRDHVLSKECRAKTWNNVTRWKRVVDAWHAGTPVEGLWEDRLETLSVEDRRSELRDVAIVNMKKVPGGRRSQMTAIYLAARNDQALLKEQFDRLNPDVVVVCGPDPAHYPYLLESGKRKLWNLARAEVQAMRWPMNGRDRVVVRTWHPQASVNARHMAESLYRALSSVK